MTYLFSVKDTVTKNLTAILKGCITRELALKFTAHKKTGDKLVFAETQLYLAIQSKYYLANAMKFIKI